MSDQEVELKHTLPEEEDNSKDRKAGYYQVILIVLVLAGLGVSLELTRVWVKVRTDPSYESICAVNQELNCMTVAESSYSAFLGIPVSVWGIAGYLSVLATAGFYYSRREHRRSLAVCLNAGLSIIAVLTSFLLLYISEALIQVLCPYCISIYVLNMLILPLALLIFFKEGGMRCVRSLLTLFEDLGTLLRTSAPLLGSVIVVTVLSIGVFKIAFPGLCTGAPQPCRQDQNIPTIDGGLKVGFTEKGHPWIGAAKPDAVISEFTDYQCPYCNKSHADLRRLLSEYKDRIRVVHRHLPLDQNCHPLVKKEFHPCACRYARYAVCAGEQGIKSFWNMNDYLFNLPRKRDCADWPQAVEATGLDKEKFEKCINSNLPAEKVHDDILESIELKIMATPTYVCDGNTLPGAISKKTLKKIISNCNKEEKDSGSPKTE